MVALPDGRVLAYTSCGPVDGPVVVGCHGLSNSGVVHLEPASTATGVRLLLPDRPGCGDSDSAPERRLLDWPDDVASLADALGVPRFAVFGVSGGGPYAAACAAALAERVTALGLVSTFGPLSLLAERGRFVPLDATSWLGEAVGLLEADPRGSHLRARAAAELSAIARDVEQWLDEWIVTAPQADREVMSDIATRAMYVASARQAVSRGVEDYVTDMVVALAPDWGFDPASIAVPVELWHGEQDPTVPVAMARGTAELFSRCRTNIGPGGHLIVHSHAREILTTLTRS